MSSNFSLKKISLFIICLLLFSCASRKEIVYYQDIDSIAFKEKSNHQSSHNEFQSFCAG